MLRFITILTKEPLYLSGGYSLLIAFFAVNGITEAFAHAVMVRVHFSAELDHVRCAQKEILLSADSCRTDDRKQSPAGA